MLFLPAAVVVLTTLHAPLVASHAARTAPPTKHVVEERCSSEDARAGRSSSRDCISVEARGNMCTWIVAWHDHTHLSWSTRLSGDKD
eukprot:2534670-Amphidinium_carterae.2